MTVVHRNEQGRETPVRAERFRSAIQPRVLGRAGLDGRGNLRALYLERGQSVLRGRDADTYLSAPMMGWFPWNDDMRLELHAGARGTHLAIGLAPLKRSLRHSPEAAQLFDFAHRPAILHLNEGSETAAAIAGCFRGVLAETLTPGPMADMVIESLLHVLVIHLFRGQKPAPAGGKETAGGNSLALRFAALVESHFRDHWTVERYAATLGISRDRLHDICRRAHGKTPGALIRARLHLEARVYLENSALTLDQIAGLLGFSGAAPFNRFFKTLEGRPPGRYRDELPAAAADGRTTAPPPYAWP